MAEPRFWKLLQTPSQPTRQPRGQLERDAAAEAVGVIGDKGGYLSIKEVGVGRWIHVCVRERESERECVSVCVLCVLYVCGMSACARARACARVCSARACEHVCVCAC